MKAPNVVAVVGLLGVLLPAILTAIAQQWPPEIYWWSALATGVIAAIIKAIEVWRSAKTPETPEAPPSGAMSAMSFGAPAPTEGKPGKWRSLLLG